VSRLTRREALQSSGVVLAFGVVAAACASNESGGEPGRVGFAPPPPTLPEVEDPPSDATLTRTLQSMEYAALELYKSLLAMNVLTDEEQPVFDRIVEDHTRHADEMGQLITGLGAEEFACPNPFIMDRSVNPVLAATDGSDDLHRDVLNIAWAFETNFGASYQSFVSMLQAPELRTAAVLDAGEECRHSTVLARMINPDETFASTFFGVPEEKNAEGFVVPYAIPSVFGRVSSVELVVGNVNAEGSRFSIQLQTPAANTFAYEYMSCPG
jgi:Ferritin-like domain